MSKEAETMHTLIQDFTEEEVGFILDDQTHPDITETALKDIIYWAIYHFIQGYGIEDE